MKKMCGVHKVAKILLMIGGLNWLLVGIFQQDLFSMMGLAGGYIARAAYVLIGLSALSMFAVKKCCMKGGCACGSKGCGECCAMDKEKAIGMKKPCACGSGKPGWQCCMKGDAEKMKGCDCLCGSGKKVEDCCMKGSETQQ